MDQPGTVVSRLEAFNSLVVILNQTINRALGSSTLKSLLNVVELLCVKLEQSCTEMLPETSPVIILLLKTGTLSFGNLTPLGVGNVSSVAVLHDEVNTSSLDLQFLLAGHQTPPVSTK